MPRSAIASHRLKNAPPEKLVTIAAITSAATGMAMTGNTIRSRSARALSRPRVPIQPMIPPTMAASAMAKPATKGAMRAAAVAGGLSTSAVSATGEAISGMRPCAMASRID